MPTRLNIFKRKVVGSSACPLCGVELECVIHALRDYEFVRFVWCAAEILIGNRLWEAANGWEWLMLVWDMDEDIADLVVTIAWLLRYERNLVVYEGIGCYAGGIISKTEDIFGGIQSC